MLPVFLGMYFHTFQRLTAIGRKLHMIFRLFCIKTEYLLLVLWVYT